MLVEEKQLMEAVTQICCEEIRDDSSSGVCPAWLRMNILISRGYVKRRSLKKSPVYQLLDMGREVASRLKERNSQEIKTVRCADQDRNQHSSQVKDSEALYTNDCGMDGVILLVDTKELGGDRLGLNQLCQSLEHAGLCIQSRYLKCGDYQWLWRKQSCETILPVLVERKRADDLADSLNDGRYERQRTKMLAWRDMFGIRQEMVSLKYVVESDPELYMVRCLDGCRGVGRCGGPSVEHVQAVISELATDPDFDLVRTENITETIQLLASITIELSQRVENGDFQELMPHDAVTNTTHMVSEGDLHTAGPNEVMLGGSDKKRKSKKCAKPQKKKGRLEGSRSGEVVITEYNKYSVSDKSIHLKSEKDTCIPTNARIVPDKPLGSKYDFTTMKLGCKSAELPQIIMPDPSSKLLVKHETNDGIMVTAISHAAPQASPLNCQKVRHSNSSSNLFHQKDINKLCEPASSQDCFSYCIGSPQEIDDALLLPSLRRHPRRHHAEPSIQPTKCVPALPDLDLDEYLPGSSTVVHNTVNSLVDNPLSSNHFKEEYAATSDTTCSDDKEKCNMDVSFGNLPTKPDTDYIHDSILLVREILPHEEEKNIRDILQLCDGSVERTIAYILDH